MQQFSASITYVAEQRARHIIDRLGKRYHYDDANRKLVVNQFSDCARLLPRRTQSLLGWIAANNLLTSDTSPHNAELADFFIDVYRWKYQGTGEALLDNMTRLNSLYKDQFPYDCD